MSPGTKRNDGARLSPAPSRRIRVASFAAAVALHGAAIVFAASLVADPVPPEAMAVDVVLVAQVVEPEAPEAQAAAPEAIASVEEPQQPAEPVPIVEERPQPVPEPLAQPVAQPAEAPEAQAPLPPPPPRRPAPAAPTAPVQEPASAPAVPAMREAPSVAVVPVPKPANRAETDYVSALLGWLERYKNYPRAARLRRIEGTTIVRLAVLADGGIASLAVARSSGHAVLDEASIEMIRRAAPLPRPPAGAPVYLEVPVVFRVHGQ